MGWDETIKRLYNFSNLIRMCFTMVLFVCLFVCFWIYSPLTCLTILIICVCFQDLKEPLHQCPLCHVCMYRIENHHLKPDWIELRRNNRVLLYIKLLQCDTDVFYNGTQNSPVNEFRITLLQLKPAGRKQHKSSITSDILKFLCGVLIWNLIPFQVG